MAIHVFLSIVALAYFSSISAVWREVCRTRICVDYAIELRNNMNTKIKPCDNFYEYVCGNWGKNYPVPEYDKWHSQSTVMTDRIKKRVLEILEAKNVGGKNRFVKKARELYKGCMDTSTIEKNGVGEIMNYIKKTGGWPIIMSKWEKNKKKTWETVDSEYNVITGTSLFVDFAVELALKKSDINYLVVRPFFSILFIGDSSSIVTNRKGNDDLFRDPAVKEEMNLIKKIAGVMAKNRGFVLNETQVERDAQGIVRLLYNLERTAGSPGPNSTYLSTIKQFQAFSDPPLATPTTRGIDWLQRIRQLFVRKSSVTIDSSEKIVIHHPFYFKRLFSILSTFSEQDIVNTIQWWFVRKTLTSTNPEMLGIRDPRPRWMKCFEENELQYVLAYVQVKYDVLKKSKARVVNMVKEIKIAMKKKIHGSKWLGDHSKRAAEKKVDSMTTLVGYPDWYNDPTKLGNELYKNLLIGSSYLENVLLAKQFGLQQKLESLRKPFDEWSLAPSIIDTNAYYNRGVNLIALPAGILQEPLFNAGYPVAINYGGIGGYISHEMSHAFDSRGIHFDKHGTKGVWWSENSILEYEKRCQGFIDQFNKHGVSGKQTLNENIADSMSVIAAFTAYKKHTGLFHYINTKLPGLENLSSDKLFFVSFAWSQCTSVESEYARFHPNEDVHSPLPQRVNGALSNSKYFSETFKCKKNSRMNQQKERCTIW